MKQLIVTLKDKITGKVPSGTKRSSKWPKVREDHLKQNPKCAVCEGTAKVEVHHLSPFHLSPEKELDPTNLITLCEAKRYGLTCHLLVGHRGDYKKVNPYCKVDAAAWNQKIKAP